MLPHIHTWIRCPRPVRIVLRSVLCLLLAGAGLSAQAAQRDPDDLINVSYIHAAVLGTGSYTLNDRRVTMLKLPLSWKQRAETPESLGWRWLAPVVFGYDDLSQVDSGIIDALMPDQLITLSVMPGLEMIFPVRRNWYLKPFVELGGGRDFRAEETFALAHLGLRSLSHFRLSERWRLQLGAGLRWAGEYQVHSEDTNAFGIAEVGLDVRRDLPWRLFDQRLDVGTYYVYQRYLPVMMMGDAVDWKNRAMELHEFGLSLGLEEGRKILGISVRRVRVGFKKGGKFQGWTVGTEFPF